MGDEAEVGGREVNSPGPRKYLWYVAFMVLPAWIYSLATGMLPLAILGLPVFMLLVYFSLTKLECPECGKSVRTVGAKLTHCLHCGASYDRAPGVNHDPYPTPETVHEWDGPSLFSETGFQAVERARLHGFDSLNEAERVLSCLFCFDNDVNNGGFGMWLGETHPESLLATVPALHTVGAIPMARFVEELVSELDGLTQSTAIDEWQEHFASLPDSYHEDVELLSSKFLELEPTFLEAVYAFARAHWQEVRAEWPQEQERGHY